LDLDLTSIGYWEGMAWGVSALFIQLLWGRDRQSQDSDVMESIGALKLYVSDLSLTPCIPLEHSKSFLRLSFPFL